MEEIELQILKYLSSNPDADDTVRGITEWWLLTKTVQSGTAEVERALAVLVSRGMVVQWPGHDGGVHYKLDARCRTAVEQLLSRYYAGMATRRKHK